MGSGRTVKTAEDLVPTIRCSSSPCRIGFWQAWLVAEVMIRSDWPGKWPES